MVKLNLERINEFAPYKVEFESGHMCDSANNQQAQRSRLFLYWFSAYGKQKEYYTCTEMVKDEDEENYISIIVKKSHPQLNAIINLFNKQIEMFRMNKP